MNNSKFKIGGLVLSTLILAACGGGGGSSSNNSDGTGTGGDTGTVGDNGTGGVDGAQFRITTTNLTNTQTMSPVAVVMHNAGFNNFIDGETASEGVERLAEGGDNSLVLSDAAAAAEYISSASTSGPVAPSSVGESLTLDVPTDQLSDLRLSVMTMLIRTNDAFTGLNATNISDMEVGSSKTFNAPTWDAGTELDDEAGVNMPGTGGEGFNATRDDRIDLVRFHNGVVTNASPEFGLATSDLVEADRFLNPTSRIVVERIR